MSIIEAVIREEVQLAIKGYFQAQAMAAVEKKPFKKGKASEKSSARKSGKIETDEQKEKRRARSRAWHAKQKAAKEAKERAKQEAIEIAMNEQLANEMLQVESITAEAKPEKAVKKASKVA